MPDPDATPRDRARRALSRLRQRPAVQLVERTLREWLEDRAPQLSAALAFYAIFSIAPLLVLLIYIAGLFYGSAEARTELLANARELVGVQVADALEVILVAADQPRIGNRAAILGFVAILFGASGVFAQLKASMNRVWEIEPPRSGLRRFLVNRITGFLVVLLVGALLVASLAASATLVAVAALLPVRFPGGYAFWHTMNVLVSLLVATGLFALLFKYLPDVRIAWRDVGIGAAVTGTLFVLGKELIALYLARSSTVSIYGAAGSLVLVLLWIYYTSLILFLGAEFTQVYARTYGTRIRAEGREPPGEPSREPNA